MEIAEKLQETCRTRNGQPTDLKKTTNNQTKNMQHMRNSAIIRFTTARLHVYYVTIVNWLRHI